MLSGRKSEPPTARTKIREPNRLVTEENQGMDAEKCVLADSSGVVDWECESDPLKPMNWRNARKAKNIIVICYCSFLTPLGSTMVRDLP